ncbi:MAG: threonylcarbamoyl-AMP synthase [Myxacorys californica WJT36-NPBG1]|jgi:tRNA threonylcarbamoyl adenosine modification protein (Sua5/YciO/YrdC/YwlC family)|nr:threonylcarbamoyl-AMP synthase [Myxacorys californica WJT36-NPBG1]
MATTYKIHPDTPQARSVDQIVDALRSGATVLYPTDTVYAIGCDLNSKSGVERVRKLKQMSNDKPLTFLCPSLSDIAQYAVVTDQAYRIMRSLIPGPYTFLLPATKLVPKLVMNPKRKTTGIRVPDSAVCQALLSAMGNPLISTSAHVPVDDETIPVKVRDPENLSLAELFDSMNRLVDVIVDTGEEPSYTVSTILDLTGDEPAMVRKGLGWQAASEWASVA